MTQYVQRRLSSVLSQQQVSSMARVKLLTDGGYKGLELAVGHTFQATKVLGHWNISSDELIKVGCQPSMLEYAFLQREIEVVHAFC